MDAVLLFLPLLGALVAHAPVLRWNLFPALRRPIDAGTTLRGRRLLGDNKTWRGVIFMWSGVFVATLLLSYWPRWWSNLPADVQRAGAPLVGALLGLGTVLGELPNSLLKRQLDVPPGEQRRSVLGVLLSIYDQADFVPAIWLTLLPVWRMPLATAAAAFVVVTAIHLIANVVGWAIGARTAPI